VVALALTLATSASVSAGRVAGLFVAGFNIVTPESKWSAIYAPLL